MSKKPRITNRCVADNYSAPNERIIEIGAGSKGAGCLISIRYDVDTDTIYVNPYCCERVKVIAGMMLDRSNHGST